MVWLLHVLFNRLPEGTRVRVPSRGERVGTIVGFERQRVGANGHYIQFDHEVEKVQLRNEPDCDVVQPGSVWEYDDGSCAF